LIAQSLGSYRILARIGEGGMGEVYRARDSRLERDVALKVLPPFLAADPDARARFEREARAIAALSHPNILAIHDFGSSEGVDYAVMELLEGETLRARLGSGPLPSDKAVEICGAVAHGLAAAHERDVIHRDLKPENIFVLQDGRVKILDFGLARRSSSGPATQDSATQLRATEPGTVLGTVGYMSPEQVRGDVADHRSDIFSLGCVLFELLTGRAPFARETAAETMTAVLREDPPWQQLEDRGTPTPLEQVVRHCLEKRPAERFQSARDLAFALHALTRVSSSRGVAPAPPVRRRPVGRVLAALGLIAVGAAFASAVVAWRLAASKAPDLLAMTSVASPPDVVFAFHHGFGVSPDGTRIVFAARAADGSEALWLRNLADDRPRRLDGTAGASYPFWSPDGRDVGFFAANEVKRVPADGGPVQVICGTTVARFLRGAWPTPGTILLSGVHGVTSGVFRVTASGGTPERVTPDGVAAANVQAISANQFAYAVRTPESMEFYLASLDGASAPVKVAGLDTRYAHFVPAAGVVLFSRGLTLYAQRFDADAGELLDEPLAIARAPGSPMEWFALSLGGPVLAMLSPMLDHSQGDPGDPLSRLLWIDRSGREVGNLPRHVGRFWGVRLSPDGRRAAVNPDADIWIYDDVTGGRTRLTSSPVDEWNAVWSADGRRLVHRADPDLMMRTAEGEGTPELLIASRGERVQATDWSRDGRYLLLESFAYSKPNPTYDVELYDLQVRARRSLLATSFDEGSARFSPSGTWIAYATNATGTFDVYVRRVEGGAALQVSTAGGSHPVWSRDGRELFYLTHDDRIVAVDTSALEARGVLGRSAPLFRTAVNRIMPRTAPYDVSPDGQRFVVNVLEAPEPLTVIQGWQALLARKP
jgi:Tol biopolymer transport system component